MRVSLTNGNVTPEDGGVARTNQKLRTRAAIIQAARDLARSGAEITMPSVAEAALVSEATAYRYFPDLVSLLREADAGLWPSPAESLAPVSDTADPVERIGYATEVLLRGVLSYQSAVRAMIAGSITRPEAAAERPGHRFGLIDHALAPFAATISQTRIPELDQLKRDLAVVMSAEALFILTDLCGLSADEAVASAVQTAKTLTTAAVQGLQRAANSYPAVAPRQTPVRYDQACQG
jgi:AcrR family transcriptional regulator